MTDVHRLDSCDSTNDRLRELAENGAPSGTVVLAEHQRAGKGRRGAHWHSPGEGNLYVSILHRSERPSAEAPGLAIVTGVVCAQTLARWTPVKIKWPNDLTVDGKKLGGILVEAKTSGARTEYIIVGIGLNIASRSFPREIESIATSLQLVCEDAPTRDELWTELAEALAGALRRYESGGLATFTAAANQLLDRGLEATLDDGFVGRPSSVADDGALVLVSESGKARVLVSASVLWRRVG